MNLGKRRAPTDAPSLRKLATAAAVSHFFKDNKAALAKCYRLGTLPVMVIDDIYCQFAREAIAKSKEALKQVRDNCNDTYTATKEAKFAFTDAQERMYRGQQGSSHSEELKKLKDKYEKILDDHRADCTAYTLEAGIEIEKLKETQDILTKEEREAIAKAYPNGEIEAVSKELADEVSPSKLFYSWTPPCKKQLVF